MKKCSYPWRLLVVCLSILQSDPQSGGFISRFTTYFSCIISWKWKKSINSFSCSDFKPLKVLCPPTMLCAQKFNWKFSIFASSLWSWANCFFPLPDLKKASTHFHITFFIFFFSHLILMHHPGKNSIAIPVTPLIHKDVDLEKLEK